MGEIAEILLIVMIDYGATNNFIASQFVEESGIQYSNYHKFGATLGIKEVVGLGECKGVNL